MSLTRSLGRWSHAPPEVPIWRQQTPESLDNERGAVNPAIQNSDNDYRGFLYPGIASDDDDQGFVNPGIPNSDNDDRGFVNPATSNNVNDDRGFVNPGIQNSDDHDLGFVNPAIPNSDDHDQGFVNPGIPNSDKYNDDRGFVNPAISNNDDDDRSFVNPAIPNSDDHDQGFVNPGIPNSDDAIFNQVDGDHDDSDEQCLNLNTVEELARGIIKTRMNKFREYTILLVGETGTGKTTFLSLLANILSGRNVGEYEFIHDEANEAGGGERHSQTMSAKHYLFESSNGVNVCILDTPGLVDTRGLEQDKQHKASIVGAIKDHIPTVNAVLILANGTLPRLGAATDYALSTLSSIFPRSLADNIGILFTNVDDRLSWNFDQESMLESLRNTDRQFLVNNPLAKWKKYVELCSRQDLKKKEQAKLKGTVREAHQKALAELVLVFDWLDTLEPQPTKEILHLYEKQSARKKARLQNVLTEVDNTRSTMDKYQHYQEVVKEKVWTPCPTLEANTICLLPDCYSNCPINRPELEKSHRSEASAWEEYWGQHVPVAVGRPAAWLISGYFSIHNYLLLPNCPRCKHPYHHHTHDCMEWRQKDHQRIVINQDAENKYTGAKDENEKQEALKATIQETINDLSDEIEDCLNRLGLLTEEYSKLSLSGSFTGQVGKTVVLLELNLESMRNNGTVPESVRKVEKSLERMKEMLSILEKAKAKSLAGARQQRRLLLATRPNFMKSPNKSPN
ncbi:hypothetical protein JOM56_005252 [Amanita muscaria]